VCFLSETGGVYEWKKNLMLAAIQLIKVSAVVFAISALSFGVGFFRASSHAEAHAPSSQPNADPNWSELVASMDKMHMAMEAVEYSGNSDVDFVRLMLPHHQAAVDMAKTQLLHGKDPQMRRLAQEIITDQQLEIEVMQLWLKQHEPAQPKENQTAAPDTPVVMFIAECDCCTSTVEPAGHSGLEPRSRLHRRSDFKYGFCN
jgi:hypothetical protein